MYFPLKTIRKRLAELNKSIRMKEGLGWILADSEALSRLGTINPKIRHFCVGFCIVKQEILKDLKVLLMFYKHNSFSGRISTSEPFKAYQPQVLTELRPEVSRPVMASSGSTGSFGIANRPNNISKYQQLFQGGKHSLPVYLRGGSRDKMIYNFTMGLSFAGVVITLGTIYAMASGSLKKNS